MTIARSVARSVAGPVGRGVGGVIGGGGIHALVQSFATESGATDLDPLDALIKQVDSFNWLSNFVIYPQKAAQNAGAGSTVYSLGSLTDNDGTLVGDPLPTWGENFLSYVPSASNGMRVSDFLASGTRTFFLRAAQPTLPTGTEALLGQYDFTANKRSTWLVHRGAVAGDPYEVGRSADGTAGTTDAYRSGGGLHDINDNCYIVQWVDGGIRRLWKNATEISLTLASGDAQTTHLNTDVDITLACVLSAGAVSVPARLDASALAILEGPTPTDDQRNTIKDLILAL